MTPLRLLGLLVLIPAAGCTLEDFDEGEQEDLEFDLPGNVPTFDFVNDEFAPFEDGFVGQAPANLGTPAAVPACAGLSGGFAADELAFFDVEDPDVFEDFGGLPDFSVEFGDGVFDSTLFVDGELLSSAGRFDVVGDLLLLDGPLVPGMGVAPTVLSCGEARGVFTLSGPTTFDFVDDDFDDFVDADFDAVLSPVP